MAVPLEFVDGLVGAVWATTVGECEFVPEAHGPDGDVCVTELVVVWVVTGTWTRGPAKQL